MPDYTCPHCHRNNDMATVVDKEATHIHVDPVDGDYLFCLTCGDWGVVDAAHRRVRRPTADELEQIRVDAHCVQLMRAWISLTLGKYHAQR